MPQMKVQVTLFLREKTSTCQGPAKTNRITLQGSTSHNIMPSKPYLQNKQMFKDLIQFSKFRYGRGAIISYWVNQFLFPRRILSRSCSECEVDGVRLPGMGFHDIQGFVLSHLWELLLRASHIVFLFLFLKHIFLSPLLVIYFAYVTKLKTIRGTKKEMHSPHTLYLGSHAFPS
jgi:hypothetical protein